MKAMSWRMTLLAMAVLSAAAVTAAEVEKKAEDDAQAQAAIEKRLEDARRRLDDAARDVAELSMSMSEHQVPSIRHFTNFTRNRAMLGINLGSRGEELAEGVTVASVSPGGAAERAGLKAGDVLIEIEGKALKRDGELSAREVLMNEMGEVKPGDKVKLRYRRDNKVSTVNVTAEAPMNRMFTMPMPVRGQIGAGVAMPMPPLALMRAVGVFGTAELVPMTPKLGQYFGTEKGLLVVRAPADSRLQLEDGDVILDIDGRTPVSPTHAFRILGSYQPGEQLKLNVLRQKKRMSFEITVPDEAVRGALAPPMIFHHQDDSLMEPDVGFGIGGAPPQDSILIAPPPMTGPGPISAPRLPGARGRTIVIEDERA